MPLSDAEPEQFRSAFRRYLIGNHPGQAPKGRHDSLAWQRKWTAKLFDDGWAMPSWPREWGGMGLDLSLQLVYHEELGRARLNAQPTNSVGIVGPTLIVHGAPWQRERFLRPMARADELWCQGFSEPGAGSDLRSLTTRAERDGDFYVVTGQKVWTSHAPVADWMFALAKTDGSAGRQPGISYLLIDMSSPGITIKSIRDMTGGSRFGEVFLDDVRVPLGHLVGTEGEGWAIARTSLGHERSTAHRASALRYRRTVDDLIELARHGGRTQDPVVRQQLAAIETEVRLLIWSGARTMAAIMDTGDPGPLSSVVRLIHSGFEQRLHELAVAILGSNGMLARGEPEATEGGRWVGGLLSTRASTIGAGTAEIQRNTIAEQVLGLPRAP